jgi:1-deoxy-D-xylulose-5-phosphate reductoisomerase
MKRIVILGSTGSIGRQALEVIRQFPGKFLVTGLAAGRNWSLLAEQCKEYKPKVVSVKGEKEAEELATYLSSGRLFEMGKPEIYTGEKGLKEVACFPDADLVLTAVPGILGLVPTVAAIRAGKHIAIANKETLVTAGELVMELAAAKKVSILPVDSEHSAVWQCLGEIPRHQVAKIILTASGGPFLKEPADLNKVTVEMALGHPNWKMGRKVTIDSATLMNKGLEVIEAKWLFGLNYDQIQVVVHPQSIIHSLVEFVDGSTLAQLGVPDMRGPIQYALTYPERWPNQLPRINWYNLQKLTFEPPDLERFKCLSLATYAGQEGGTMPVVLNAANEVAVEYFLSGVITFRAIPEIVAQVMDAHKVSRCKDLEDILDADRWAKELARKLGPSFISQKNRKA